MEPRDRRDVVRNNAQRTNSQAASLPHPSSSMADSVLARKDAEAPVPPHPKSQPSPVSVHASAYVLGSRKGTPQHRRFICPAPSRVGTEMGRTNEMVDWWGGRRGRAAGERAGRLPMSVRCWQPPKSRALATCVCHSLVVCSADVQSVEL